MKTIWFDLLNTPHVQFLKPFIREFGEANKSFISCRDFSETKVLAKKMFGDEVRVVGSHGGANKLGKISKLAQRFLILLFSTPQFDVVFGCGNTEAAAVARLRGKIAINFDDNDLSPNWMYAPFTTRAFFPRVIPRERLLKQGFSDRKLYQYDGYKEDIYIADFEPDPEFPKGLPFSEYWLIRAENVQANYVAGQPGSIVPEVLKLLDKKGINVLFLPRYASDRELASGLRRVHMPDGPIDGLNAVYFSQGVMTGAGTLAREAACMGRPAVSFYSGRELLAVDRQMVEDKTVFHSRQPHAIVNYAMKSSSREIDFRHCKAVQAELFEQIEKIIKGGLV